MKRFLIVSFVLFFILTWTVSAQSYSVTGNTQGLNPTLLSALQDFANLRRQNVRVDTGVRSQARQDELWNQRLAEGGHINNNPICTITGGRGDGLTVHSRNEDNFVAKYSNHLTGNAADIGSTRDCSNLNKAGLGHTVNTEWWHVEYNGGRCTWH
jgi:hypothetical protein